MTARSFGSIDPISISALSSGPRYFNIDIVKSITKTYKMRAWSVTSGQFVCWLTSNPSASPPSQYGVTQNKCIAEVIIENIF